MTHLIKLALLIPILVICVKLHASYLVSLVILVKAVILARAVILVRIVIQVVKLHVILVKAVILVVK